MSKKLITFARANRKNPTKQEHKIWNLLKNRVVGYKFRRQHKVGNYIVDFICIEKNLIIECDGGQHNSEVDKERDEFLKSKGYKILRLWNIDIDRNMEGVYVMITKAIHTSP
ncbi:MAG: endonuclease domain-containing protein [Elusimicrobia bacterium]|nr:endonuclease domain-containing protein [Elusimicrobiota bacterium]